MIFGKSIAYARGKINAHIARGTLQGSGMPLPALRCRSELAIVKMVMASELSLRGPKGAVAISQYTAESQAGSGENVTACTRLPRRFAPRNDTSGECRSAPAPSCGLMILYKALTERRYRRNWGVRFFDSLYGTAVPSRDCPVGCASSQ